MICKKSDFPPFPESYTIDHSPPVMNIVAKSTTVVVDAPNLYIHMIDDENENDSCFFNNHLETAHKIYKNDLDYQLISREIEQECYLSIVDLDPVALIQNF